MVTRRGDWTERRLLLEHTSTARSSMALNSAEVMRSDARFSPALSCGGVGVRGQDNVQRLPRCSATATRRALG